ncbi:MAG TPA: ISKra4 family transposase, partial [Spirochaetia bacterium]|nr:ISKra4 family transposase [Spirochaetia bacterium]
NPVKDKGSERYSAAIESCAWSDTCKDTPAFARRVERELTRSGFFGAQRQVFIGDGAPWIWNLATMIAPLGIQIVDLYHAKEHLSLLAGDIFGPGSDLARK